MGTIDNSKPPVQGGVTGPVSSSDGTSQSNPLLNFINSLEKNLNTQTDQTKDANTTSTTIKDSFAGSDAQGNFNSTTATAVSTPGSPVLRTPGVGSNAPSLRSMNTEVTIVTTEEIHTAGVQANNTAEIKKADQDASTKNAAGLGNKWMQNLGQAVYLEAMRHVATIQSKMKLQEMMSLVKQTGANQANIDANAANIRQQAMLEFASAMVQAAVQIVSATVAAGLAGKTAKSGISARNEVRQETKALKENPKCKDTKKWVEEKHACNEDGKKLALQPRGPDRTKAEANLQERENKLAETKPGYQQFHDYNKGKSTVETSDTPINDKSTPKEKGKIEDPKEKTKWTNNDAHEESESGKATTAAKEKIGKDGEAKQEESFIKRSDESGDDFQKRVETKTQANTAMVNLVNQVNSSLTDAAGKVIKGTFDLIISDKKEAAVYIQAALEQTKALADLANQMHSTHAQNLDSIWSSISNTQQIFGQVNKYGG